MSNPSKATCAAVDERDNHSCARCGVSLYSVSGSRHHRKLRSQGGKHDVTNLVLLCGSGTTGCHGWVHGHPKDGYESGHLVVSSAAPEDMPVEYADGWFELVGFERFPVTKYEAYRMFEDAGFPRPGLGVIF